MSISNIYGPNNLLMDVGKSIQEQIAEAQERSREGLQEPDLAPTSAAIERNVVNQFSGDTVDLSGMFTHSGKPERSKYIDAFFESGSQLKRLQQSFNSGMASLAATLKGENPLNETAGMRRARQMQQIYEASQVNLDEIKQDIEIKVKQTQARARAEARAEAEAEHQRQLAKATTPKNENGDPVEELAAPASGGWQPVRQNVTVDAEVDIDIPTEDLEARNIQVNIKAPTIKVDVKI